jgi:hypothetical protein
MNTQQRERMTMIIFKQVTKLMKNGLSYDKSLEVVFNDINEKWPLAMATYNEK